MANRIYRTEKGAQIPLSSREVKAYTMKVRGWTTDQYNKEYDKLRNRLRAYEGFQAAQGVQVKPQSAANLLYFESKSIQRNGTNYTPSLERQRIQSFPSVSSGKVLDKLLTRGVERLNERYAATTNTAFAGLISHNATAARIAAEIKDPVKREQALKDFSAKLHAKMDSSGRIRDTGAIPFGQAVGSDEAIEFDLSPYL